MAVHQNLRASALLALTKLMALDPAFCDCHLQLVFTLLQNRCNKPPSAATVWRGAMEGPHHDEFVHEIQSTPAEAMNVAYSLVSPAFAFSFVKGREKLHAPASLHTLQALTKARRQAFCITRLNAQR